MNMYVVATILLLVSFSIADEPDFSNIDAWFDFTLTSPGGGYAIVTKDEIIHTHVTGVRDRATEDPVTVETYFPIASITKTMTSLLIHNLTLEGKCSWNSRIVSILPFWECGDPVRSSMMTLQDLVYHQTGFGAYSGSFPSFTNPELSLRDYIYSLKFFMPLAEFRAPTFLYNNAAFSLAGYVAEYLEDMDFKDLIQERILNQLDSQPKGYYSLADLEEDGVEYSQGYMEDEEGNLYEPDQCSCRGLALSLKGLAEFAQWFMPIISNSSHAAMTEMGNFFPVPARVFPSLDWMTISPVGVGRGVFISDVWGTRCYSHNGNSFGHSSFFVVCPEVDYGFAGLNNLYAANDNLENAAFSGLYQYLYGGVPPPPETETLSHFSLKKETKFGSSFKDDFSPEPTKFDTVTPVQSDIPPTVSITDFDETQTEWHHPFSGVLTAVLGDSIVESDWSYNHLPMVLSHWHSNSYWADSAYGRLVVQFVRCPVTGIITSVKIFFGGENYLFTSASYLREDVSFKPNDAATQDPRVVKFVEPAVHTNNMPIALILGALVGLIASGGVGGLMFYLIRKTLGPQQESYALNPLTSNKV
ncbi:hypothetical protein GEMRC1_002539 [Eukaryota sp. GEM-RC1]